MQTKFKDIQIIAAGLAFLYGTSLAFYLQYFSTTAVNQIQVRPLIICVLLAVLLVGSIAVVQLKEWGRNVLIVTNAFMGLYIMTPYLLTDLVPHSFAIMSIIVIMFFSQRQISIYFRHVYTKPVSSHWKCILVIDDDEGFLKTLRPILMTHGFSVLTAHSGEEGLQVAKAQIPDLILLDVILPGMKGREVCKNLKNDDTTRNIPVVFLTVKDSADDIHAEKDVGAAAHMTKPIASIKPFILTIQEVLQGQPFPKL